jgi:hypothetical protein
MVLLTQCMMHTQRCFGQNIGNYSSTNIDINCHVLVTKYLVLGPSFVLLARPICLETEVLRAAVVNSFIFWNITPCSPLKIKPSFGGTCRLYLQGRRINQARNQCEAGGRWLMPATYSSETSVDIQRTTHRYNPAARSLQTHLSIAVRSRSAETRLITYKVCNQQMYRGLFPRG